ncbi:MAG: DUF1349 domain-containing protein [Alphaproteobacteria bacterium]|nr:DUF1349 domain-containing protein [Alphaproteobacteria bacterium]
MNTTLESMTWMNEPPFHALDDGILTVRSGMKTDFWQSTYYGFHRDDGHFLWTKGAGDFTAQVAFRGHYEALYDQAGMMMRADARHWIKCGIELTDGHAHLSVVVTNGQSDWSAIRLPDNPDEVFLRMTRLGDAVFIQYSLDDADWAMARLAYFPPAFDEVKAGIAFCSPEREGFEASFRRFEIGEPLSRNIH